MSERTLNVTGAYGTVSVELTGRVNETWLEIFAEDRTDWIPLKAVAPEHWHRIPKIEVAREEERRGILRLSQEMLQPCQNEHLAWLVRRVWSRLPARERTVLVDLLEGITDQGSRDPEFICLNFNSDFKAGQTLLPVTHRLSVAHALQIETDAARMFLIALEFAHVVLRHPQPAVTYLRAIEGPEFKERSLGLIVREEWMKDNATLLVWGWGFEEEYRAYLRVCPAKYKSPYWYDQVALPA